MADISDIVTGVLVETFLAAVVFGSIYRVWGGRFLIPKREIVLPNQLGVVVEGTRVVRVAEPGSCWVRPKQRIVNIDARPRPLQMLGVEVVAADNGVVRISLSGEFQVSDASVYYKASTNANESLHVAVRMALIATARQLVSTAFVSVPEVLASRVAEAVTEQAASLGFRMTTLRIWEAIPVGWLPQQSRTPDTPELSSGPLIH